MRNFMALATLLALSACYSIPTIKGFDKAEWSAELANCSENRLNQAQVLLDHQKLLLGEGQAEKLKDAGLDYYNHNLDTAPEFYDNIISTRDYQDRLDTLERVRGVGIKVCCGGIVGMGESRLQRAGLIAQLCNMDPYPESVPVNNLVQVEGTPLHGTEPIDPLEFVRTVAVARITMPKARVRLSAGRREMGEAIQALCFVAGANSIFYGDKLLTTGNPEADADVALLNKLGMHTRNNAIDARCTVTPGDTAS